MKITPYFITLATLLSTISFAQDVKRVRSAEGVWPVVNISPEVARLKAIDEAKKEACRKAGILESVHTTEFSNKSDNQNSSWQLFSTLSSIELHGGVTNFTLKEDNLITSGPVPQYRVVLDAEVAIYNNSKSDSEFTLEINGLYKASYKDGDALGFSITPSKAGYLNIFLLEAQGKAFKVYPNELERSRLFAADSTYTFPQNKTLRYTLEKSTPGSSSLEQNYILILFTKNDIRPIKEITYHNILNWINTIAPEDRFISYESVVIL